MNDRLNDALASLRELTECRCHEAFKGRGLLDPECHHDYREDVDAVVAEVDRLTAERDRRLQQAVDLTAQLDSLAAMYDSTVGTLTAQRDQARRALAGHLFDGESLSTREAIRNELIEAGFAAEAELQRLRAAVDGEPAGDAPTAGPPDLGRAPDGPSTVGSTPLPCGGRPA